MAFRPSFSLDVAVASPALIERLAAELAKAPVQLRRTRVPGGGTDAGTRDSDHLVVTIPVAERHFWSPWLTVEVEPRETGAHLVGSFSPHPSVWTGFMFGYLALAIVFVFAAIFAAAVLMMGGSPWSLWVAAGAIVGMVAMWWASKVGQRLARAQMATLRAALERALEAASA